MVEFAEMLNLFTMYLAALGIAGVLVVTDFFEHIVFDTIRMRGKSWEFAHELMLVVFRRIEDSGGRITLANASERVHMEQLMLEATANTTEFFRSPGGNPGNVKNGEVFVCSIIATRYYSARRRSRNRRRRCTQRRGQRGHTRTGVRRTGKDAVGHGGAGGAGRTRRRGRRSGRVRHTGMGMGRVRLLIRGRRGAAKAANRFRAVVAADEEGTRAYRSD